MDCCMTLKHAEILVQLMSWLQLCEHHLPHTSPFLNVICIRQAPVFPYSGYKKSTHFAGFYEVQNVINKATNKIQVEKNRNVLGGKKKRR